MSSALRNTVTGYHTCTLIHDSVNLKRGKVHYALMPVWMLNTKWKGKDFLFAMNGQTGKLVGDLPVSQLGQVLGPVCCHSRPSVGVGHGAGGLLGTVRKKVEQI